MEKNIEHREVILALQANLINRIKKTLKIKKILKILV